MLEDQAVLVSAGCVVGSRSDLNDGSGFQMWELDLESKDVVGSSGHVSEFDLVGVVIELEHLSDLSDDIEVTRFLRGILKADSLLVNLTANINALESHVSPVLEGRHDAAILSLLGSSVARDGVWLVVGGGLVDWGLLVSGVESPRSLVEHVDIELSLAVVELHVSSVNSDDITESEDEWEILELGGVDHQLGVLPSLGLGELGWINDFEGADEHLVGDAGGLGLDGLLVWERGIDDDSVEVAKIS